MPIDPLPDDDALSPQVASLDAVREHLVADARSWAAQLGELSCLAARAERAWAQVRRTLALELAGSWQISQLTAERWVGQAERFYDALPQTLAMLAAGTLLRHQASVLLHRTSMCSPQIARAVEAEVLPAGAGLCPSDLGRKVDRVRLRITSEQTDAAGAERQEAEKIASRRTFTRPTEDAMVLAGAILTPEQGVAWAVTTLPLGQAPRLDPAAPPRRQHHLAQPPAPPLRPTRTLEPTTQDRPVGRPATTTTAAARRPAGGQPRHPPARRPAAPTGARAATVTGPNVINVDEPPPF